MLYTISRSTNQGKNVMLSKFVCLAALKLGPEEQTLVPYTSIQKCVWVFIVSYITRQKT